MFKCSKCISEYITFLELVYFFFLAIYTTVQHTYILSLNTRTNVHANLWKYIITINFNVFLLPLKLNKLLSKRRLESGRYKDGKLCLKFTVMKISICTSMTGLNEIRATFFVYCIIKNSLKTLEDNIFYLCYVPNVSKTFLEISIYF